MSKVIRCRTTIRAQVEVVGRQTERTVSLVRVFHQEIVNVPEQSLDKLRRTDADHQTMTGLISRRLDIRDVAHRWIRTAKAGNRRVEIATVQQVDAALILIVSRQPEQFERISLNADGALNDVRNLEIRIRLNAAGRRQRLYPANERIWKRRICDHQISLTLTIDAQ